MRILSAGTPILHIQPFDTVSQKEILPLQSQGVVDADSIRRSTLAGHPPTTVLSGTSLVTTDPDATTTLFPMVIPGLIMERPPIQTLLPMDTGFPFSRPFLRISGSKG